MPYRHNTEQPLLTQLDASRPPPADRLPAQAEKTTARSPTTAARRRRARAAIHAGATLSAIADAEHPANNAPATS